MRDPRKLTLLSYNIHKGFSTFNRKYVISEIKRAICEIRADVVFLQEILGYHPADCGAWPTPTQFEFLADSIWPHHAYGKNAVYSDGNHGNAILSSHPLLEWENIDISVHRFEKRGLLHATIAPMAFDSPIHLFCVHLDLTDRTRKIQMHRLIERGHSHVPTGERLIIAGDFNDWRAHVSPKLLRSHGLREAFMNFTGQHARSFPVWLPTLSLDRIYYRGFKVLHAKTLKGKPWNKLSDHAALLVVLEMSAKADP